jgi:hypothetical protein
MPFFISMGASDIDSGNGSDVQLLNENGMPISSNTGMKRHMQLHAIPRESQRRLSLSKKGGGEMRHTSFRAIGLDGRSLFKVRPI